MNICKQDKLISFQSGHLYKPKGYGENSIYLCISEYGSNKRLAVLESGIIYDDTENYSQYEWEDVTSSYCLQKVK